MYVFGVPANRIRGVLAFENTVFYISDEVLCCIELERFCTVLAITLINDLTSFCKILVIVQPVQAHLSCCTTFYFGVQGGAAIPRPLAIFTLGISRCSIDSICPRRKLFRCLNVRRFVVECAWDTEPPGGVLAKIFYQIDSVCSTFYVSDFILQ